MATNKPATPLPRVAIVGRPNVGKSSLYNRFSKSRKAIVYMETGTTRDRISQEVYFLDKRFILTDTGGFVPEDKSGLFRLVKEQIKKGVEEADTLLFVCDGQKGVTAADTELLRILRKANKPIFLVVNKVDNDKIKESVVDFYQLGLGKPYPVSALHDLGIWELMNDLVKAFPAPAQKDAGAAAQGESGPIKVAIVGRPNVGKSSYLNCLLKEERVIVDSIPGTTRDAVDTYLKTDKGEFILIDTAGMRHKRKVKEAVDVYSIMRTKEAIKRSHACLILIDAYEGIKVDDLKIMDLVLKEGKCLVLCVNKWDLLEKDPQEDYLKMVHARVNFLKKYPVIFTSAKTGFNVYSSLGRVREIVSNAGTMVPTMNLNRLITYIKSRPPFSSSKNKFNLTYATQTKACPPTFLMFVNNPRAVSEGHVSVIENSLRKNFGFFGTPIHFEFRGTRRKR